MVSWSVVSWVYRYGGLERYERCDGLKGMMGVMGVMGMMGVIGLLVLQSSRRLSMSKPVCWFFKVLGG